MINCSQEQNGKSVCLRKEVALMTLYEKLSIALSAAALLAAILDLLR